MEFLLGPFLLFLIVLLGLAMIIGGPAGAKSFLSTLLAPAGCLIKAVIFFFGVILVLLVLRQAALEMLRPRPDAMPPASSPPMPEQQPQDDQVLLERYPPLSQLDAENYAPAGFAERIDPQFNEPVKKLACLATVYLILERGRGNQNAVISPQTYNIALGAINPGYAGASLPLDTATVVEEIRAGRPVILHGVGGPLLNHFVLAVGIERGDAGWRIIANDPWGGQRIALDLFRAPLLHPEIGDLVFTKMRLLHLQ